MTIWIKQLYEDISNDFFRTNSSKLAISALDKALHRDLLRFGMVQCHFTGYPVDPKPEQSFYDGYSDFRRDQLSYSPLRDKREVSFCFFCKAFIYGPMVEVVLRDENGVFNKVWSCIGYAREKVKTEWWYNKSAHHYANFQWDYPAYNTTYKGSPRYWRAPDKEEVFGHEFELKFNSYINKVLFAEEIKKSYRPCITEKDGSLDDGAVDGGSLELITPPWSYQESLDTVSKIFDLAKSYCPRPMTQGYAWHVTVNLRNANSPQDAGLRLMQIINDTDYRKFWQKIARRPSVINRATGRNYCKFEDTVSMSANVWVPRWSQRPVDHYYATFLRRDSQSIEIRILKSTLDFSVFQATLEIIRAVWSFAKSDESISNWIRSLDSLSAPTLDYIESVTKESETKSKK